MNAIRLSLSILSAIILIFVQAAALAAPGVEIEKLTNGYDADTAPGPTLAQGDTVTWSYIVRNTGDVDLSEITVSDDKEGAVFCPKTILLVNESMTCTLVGWAVRGQYHNLGSVVASAAETEVSDSDPSHYYVGTIGGNPAVHLEKFTNGHDADLPPGPTIPVGDNVTWTYEVSNIGDTTLLFISVVDDQLGALAVPANCPTDWLDPNTSMTCTANGTAVLGPYENMGTVSAESPDGDPVQDNDYSHYEGIEPGNPAIDIEKATNGHDADVGPGPSIPVGDPVTWTYVVENVGDVVLTGIEVLDNQGVSVSCPASSLAPSASMTCTAGGTAVEGSYANIGTAIGFAREVEVNDSDPSHYTGVVPAQPAIDIEKATNGHDADAAPGPTIIEGDPVTWTYVVTNTGNVPLQNVTVLDNQGVAVSCPASALTPTQAMTCIANGLAVVGQYANLGTVTATSDTVTVNDEDPSHYYGAPRGAGEGCTHGYWKNHLDSWPPTGYAPSDIVADVFVAAAPYAAGAATLKQALKFKGGKGVDGASRILLRNTTASLLNAAHPNVGFPRSPAQVIAQVNAALASGDRATMLATEEELNGLNEAGDCPLN